ncbi:MAG TPA: tyrosinase family protein [Acidimicrobiales bacterium]|nr:tyrosinase family protein [Acidimicrobiales bacterium]
MAIRRDITADAAARDAYLQGVIGLKDEDTGLTTEDFGIPGFAGTPPQPLSTWDLFVLWHLIAMTTATPSGQDRNAAHTGPVFLPWHRWFLLLLETNLQRVLEDTDFGLPYWDWAADGDLPVDQQANAPVWAPECMGGNGSSPDDPVVETGPFAAATGFRVRVESDEVTGVWAVNRPLRRWFRGSEGLGLPTTPDAKAVLDIVPYDSPPWDLNSPLGFRNPVEGWTRPTGLHNLVHVWIRGDMEVATSPNDPVFYLNHCNVDRLWASWQAAHPDEPYLPGDDAPDELFRHRLSDPMLPFFTDEAATPQDMLDVSSLYTYDRLAD